MEVLERMTGSVSSGSDDLIALIDSRARYSGEIQDAEKAVEFLVEQRWIDGAALYAEPGNSLLAVSGIPEEMLQLFHNELPSIITGRKVCAEMADAVFLVRHEENALYYLALCRSQDIQGVVLLYISGYEPDNPYLTRMFFCIRDFMSNLNIPFFTDYSWIYGVINYLPGIVFQYFFRNDEEQGLRFISPQVKNITGYDPDYLTNNRGLLSVLVDHDEEQLLTRIAQSARDFLSWNIDVKVRNAAGNMQYFHVEATPQKIGHRTVLWTGFLFDISEETRLRNLQEESAEKYRRLVNSSPEAIFLLSGSAITFVNKQAVQLLGYTGESELLGKEYSNFVLQEEKSRIHLLQRNLLLGKIDALPPLDTDLIKKTGKRIAVEIRATAFILGGERIIQCVVRDVSRERYLLIALEEREELYRSLFERMISAFALHEIILDRNGRPVDFRFLEMNPAFEKLYRIRRADYLNKTADGMQMDIENHWFERFGEVALTRKSIRIEEYDDRAGKTLDVMIFSPAYGQFATISTDVTFKKKAEMQIRLERDRAQSFLNNAGTAFLALDKNGIIKMVNRRLCEIIGETEHALIGKDWYNSYIFPEDRECRFGAFKRRLDSAGLEEDWVECPIQTATGKSRLMYWRFDRINDPDSREILYLLSGEDITEQRHYEQYLNMYLKIVSASKDQLAFFDLDWNIRAQNDAMLYFLRKSREEVQDHHISELFDQQTYSEKIQPALEKAFRGREIILEDWGLFPEYKDKYYRIAISAYYGASGVVGVVYSQQDLTNQVRLEREILEASHNERRQIGMELHDNLSHGLLDLAIRSKVLSNSLMHEYPSLSRDADTISTGLTKAIETTRNLAHGLFPLNLEQGSLLTMFKGIMKSVHRSDTIAIDFHVELNEKLVDRSVATQLFFIGREAVVNSIKHSHAKSVTLELISRGNLGVLCISDDGRGISETELPGIGVNIMRYRARVIGGTITVENKNGGGVVVKCLFPLKQGAD